MEVVGGGVTLWSPLLRHPTLPSHCQVARLSVAEPPTSPAPKGSNPGRGPETGQLWGSPAARGNPGDDGKAGRQCHVLQNAWVVSIFGGGGHTHTHLGGPPLGALYPGGMGCGVVPLPPRLSPGDGGDTEPLVGTGPALGRVGRALTPPHPPPSASGLGQWHGAAALGVPPPPPKKTPMLSPPAPGSQRGAVLERDGGDWAWVGGGPRGAPLRVLLGCREIRLAGPPRPLRPQGRRRRTGTIRHSWGEGSDGTTR